MRVRIRSLYFALVFGACGLGACGGGAKSTHPARPSLLSESETRGATYPTPALWRYHPQEEAKLYARQEIGSSVVFAGARGERWLFDKRSRKVRAASSLAPEDLIGILHREGAWLFIGKSGTSYEAELPLGTFQRSSTPFEPLYRVSARGSAMVGLRGDGSIAQSTNGGATWQRVGPTGVDFVAASLGKNRFGLALAVPEAIWQTADEGASWKPLPTPTFGAYSLVSSSDGELLVRGLLSLQSFDGKGALRPVDRATPSSELALGANPPRGPSAGALRERRAVILADRYLEFLRMAGNARQWLLLQGTVTGELAASPLPAARGCELVRVAGFDRFLYFACSRRVATSTAQVLEIWRSEDSGKSFTLEPYTLSAKIGQFSLAVGEAGRLIVSGICRSKDNDNGCKPYGVHYRRKAQRSAAAGSADAKQPLSELRGPRRAAAVELAPAATPSLSDAALALAFSPDGRTAYALGRRTKQNGLAVFVSRDAGATFIARPLEDFTSEPDDDGDDDERYGSRLDSSAQEVESFSVGDEGMLGVVLRRYGNNVLAATDEEGRLLSVQNPPAEATSLGVFGTRALAVSASSRRIWESLDAGATWQSVGYLPLDVCPGDERCNVPIHCHAGGCVVGDELSRVGWRGQRDEEQALATRPRRLATRSSERKLRVPLSCSLSAEGWRRIGGPMSAPSADQAALGKAVWFAPSGDFSHAAATVAHGIGGARPRVELVTLLPPVPRGEGFAFMASRQVEGAAALRYVIPEATPGETHLRNVEVAWDNLFEGRVMRARLADAGAYSPGDYERGGDGAQAASPALLSISSGGIYLRIHRLAADRQVTFFLDGKSTSTVPAVDWPKTFGKSWRSELVRVGDTHVPLLLAGQGAGVLRARFAGSGVAFDAIATGPADPSEFQLEAEADLTYSGARPALHAMLFDRDGARRRGSVLVFRASGAVTEAPIPVPMQLDLPDRPIACSAAARGETPRVVVPYQAGTRHPIVVTDAAEPMRLLVTDRAVMHGTPSAPCVAAYDADAIPVDGSSASERAILPLDDLEHSWLFRAAPEARADAALEYRIMSCRFDPTADVPKEVRALSGQSPARGP